MTINVNAYHNLRLNTSKKFGLGNEPSSVEQSAAGREENSDGDHSERERECLRRISFRGVEE